MIAGIDTHKRTLAVAIVDDAARQQVFEEFDNTPRGHERLAGWLHAHQVRVVGVEGSGHLGRAASAALMDAGLDVREVPCMLTVRERQTRPNGGKSDPIDALAIARITLRDEASLQPARCRDDITEELRILSDYRRQLIGERIRIANRAHADLCVLHPGYKSEVPTLTSPRLVRAALDLTRQHHGVRAELLTRRLQRLVDLDDEVKQIAKRLEQLIKTSGSTLLDLPGVGVVVAARILGETGDVRRYRDSNAYASANGTAPIPASSGQTQRYRLNRRGNRLLNEALHTMALVQSRGIGPGRPFLDARRAAGKTNREAMRSLKRRLSDVVYRQMQRDQARLEALQRPVPATESTLVPAAA